MAVASHGSTWTVRCCRPGPRLAPGNSAAASGASAAALGALLLVAACSGDAAAPSGEFTERVEDGVVIAENPGLHVADTLAWTIDTTDVVSIGEVEGPEAYLIGRLAGMLRRPDGSVLIADQLSRELRLFDAQGRFLRRIGGPGEGPGEFTGITTIHDLAGDSVAVTTGHQVTVLDPDLEFVRRFRTRLVETRATPPSTSDQLVGLFADGRPLMSDYLNVCGPARSDGFCEDSVAFFRTDEEGETEARFGRFVYVRGHSALVRPGMQTGWREPHPQAMWTVAGDRFYQADAKRFEVRVYRADGTLERVIRVAGEAPRYDRSDVFSPLTPEMVADHPDGEEILRVTRESRATAPLPDSFPHFSDLLVDAEGHIWVREYLPPVRPDQAQPRWFVFDPEGRLRWAVRSPRGIMRGFRPYATLTPRIGEDWVLGSVRDDLGVERVVLYPLRKH